MKTLALPQTRQSKRDNTRWVPLILTSIALLFLTLFLFLPLACVFAEGLKKGVLPYFAAIVEADAWAAVKLTLLVAFIAVPLPAWVAVMVHVPPVSMVTVVPEIEHTLDVDAVL